MRCPYCKSELQDGSKFCEKCGQEILTKNDSSQTSKNYWDEYQAQTQKEVEDYKIMVQKSKDEQVIEKKKRVLRVIAASIIILIAASVIMIRNAKVRSIIADADSMIQDGNYEFALNRIEQGLETHPGSKALQAKIEEYSGLWITSILSSTDELATNGDYESALNAAKSGLVYFPESDELQQKVEEYTAQLNTKIARTYTGTYSIGNVGSIRGFDLEIINCDLDGNIEAIFSFYSVMDSDDLFGDFRMEGNVIDNLNDGSIVASLKGTEWINQPGSFYMMNFDVTFNEDKTIITSEDFNIFGIDKAMDEPFDYPEIVKTFSGTYKPTWGISGLDLCILNCNEKTGDVTAEFNFYQIDDNDRAKNGRFLMIGKIVNIYPDGAIKIALKGDEWIDKPSSTSMIDFYLTINAARDAATADSYQIELSA